MILAERTPVFWRLREHRKWPTSRSTCLCFKTVTKINETVLGDRCMSIRMIAETINRDKETTRKIVHNKLNMKKVCVKLVPKTLIPDQKLTCQQICSDYLERLDKEPELMEKIITCDKTRIFQNDVETKWRSLHWKTPALRRVIKVMSKSKFKAVLIVFPTSTALWWLNGFGWVKL